MKKFVALKSLPLIFLALLLYNCKKTTGVDNEQINQQYERTFVKEGSLYLTRSGEEEYFKKIDIEIAETKEETAYGLMYLKKLEENQGMLFVSDQEKDQSFFMKNTYIPLDILYFNKNKELIGINKNTIPFDEETLPAFKAQYVLEVPAGSTDKWQLKVGSGFKYDRIEL